MSGMRFEVGRKALLWKDTQQVRGDTSSRATRATAVDAAIGQAGTDGLSFVFVPQEFLDYDASAVNFTKNGFSGRLVREGQVSDAFDVKAYGATTGTADDQAPAFKAAADAMPSEGGVLHVPTDSGGYRIATTVTLSKPILVAGGWFPAEQTQNGASRIIKDAGLASEVFTYEAIGCGVVRLQIEGEAGNSGDGIVVNRGQGTVRDVAIFGMGQDGLRVGGSDGNTCNLFRLENVRAFNNGRHGINVDDTGQGGGVVDANAGVGIGLDCKNNGGDGLRVGAGRHNTFLGARVESNTAAGIHLTSEADLNMFVGGSWDEGSSPDLQVDAGASDNAFIYPNVQQSNVTDNGTNTTLLLTRGSDDSELANTVLKWGGGGAGVALRADTDAGEFTPLQIDAGTRSLILGAASTGGTNDITIEETTGVVRLSEQGKKVAIGAGASAPADGDLNDAEVVFWIDETNDELEVKVKKSDGTVLSGTLTTLT